MIQYNKTKWRKKLMISTPTEGWIRYEWAHARFGQVVPVNWEAGGFDICYATIGYSVEDAYNVITEQVIKQDCEWLVVIEDDVIIPHDLFIKFGEYMNKGDIPIVSGLYYTKGNPSEPLIFRGRGNGVFLDWKRGNKVWADGIPMGCFLIHTSILKYMSDHSEEYKLPDGVIAKRVFETPRKIIIDKNGAYHRQEGTQDLTFCDRVMKEKVLKKTGFTKVAHKKYPFLCDTSIFCKHIDRGSGRQYPDG